VRFSLAFVLLVAVLGGVAATGVGIYYYQNVASDLPDVSVLRKHKPSLVTRFFDRNGSLLREFYVERRFLVTLDQIPDVVIKAILATEDARFEDHPGVDVIGIVRAAVKNIIGWGVIEGGSTITQQLAKSMFLSPVRTIDRKIREAILAVRIERTFSKREILTLYLNQIYFGEGAYGIEAAARVYFGKNAESLTLAEAALLAGLPRAPSRYSPFKFYRRALRRRAHVLRRMIDENFITPQEWARAEVSPIRLVKKLPGRGVTDYAVEFVRRRLERLFGGTMLYRGGLKVYTTIQRGIQQDVNASVRKGILSLDRRRGYRGPIGSVDLRWPRERIWRMVGKLMGGRGHRREFRTGRWMPAVVADLNEDEAKLRLKRGPAVLRLDDSEWARPFDPRKNWTGTKLEDFRDILRRGDVVLVERLEREKMDDGARGKPVPVALVQEPKVQAAALVTIPESGAIRTMVGGYDFERSQFNRAYQAVRPPGSAFKPVIYSAAFSDGWTPSDIIMDTPIIFPQNGPRGYWKPTNFEKKFYGPTTLREALIRSRNVVTVKLANAVGVAKVIKRARDFGIRSPLQPNLSIALGSSGITLLELTSLYATLANQGRRVEPHIIRWVENSEGKSIWNAKPAEIQSIPPEEAYVMLSLLQNVIQSGTAIRAKRLGRPLAGKTGTTNDYQDAWFVGVSPQYSTGVWVGMDDKSTLGRLETGSRAALPIWMDITEAVHEGLPKRRFRRPGNVEFITIDPHTGIRVPRGTEGSVRQVFVRGSEPSSVSPGSRRKKKGVSRYFREDAALPKGPSKPSRVIGDIITTIPSRHRPRPGRRAAPAFDPFRSGGGGG
jgi:penicillin-binding protein 1A